MGLAAREGESAALAAAEAAIGAAGAEVAALRSRLAEAEAEVQGLSERLGESESASCGLARRAEAAEAAAENLAGRLRSAEAAAAQAAEAEEMRRCPACRRRRAAEDRHAADSDPVSVVRVVTVCEMGDVEGGLWMRLVLLGRTMRRRETGRRSSVMLLLSPLERLPWPAPQDSARPISPPRLGEPQCRRCGVWRRLALCL